MTAGEEIREKILSANLDYQLVELIPEMVFENITEALKWLHKTYYETMTGKEWDGIIY